MANNYKAEDLIKLLRSKYTIGRTDGYQSHVLLEQVPDGTSRYQGHWIDAVVFSLWLTKGLTRSAFEIKVSRSDFIHELQNPLKHKWALDCFHEFWFVAPQDVIQLEELPTNVGWMYPRGDKLAVKRHAVRNDNPKLDDILLAGFMRSASKEMENARKAHKEDILQNDKGYNQAREYEAAVVAFCQSHEDHSFFIDLTKEQIIEHLDNATMDKQLKQDREKLLSVTARFQREILGLLPLFLTIAKRSLTARDALGKYIISEYGGVDNESFEALREYAKGKHSGDKRYAELIDLLLTEQEQ